MNIFIVLGSQEFQFDRLIKAIDNQISQGMITDEVFAQIGPSNYKPKYYEYIDFISRHEFEERLNKADIVITHGGTGTIVQALKMKKKVIAVPRLKKYKEHVDNHQLQIIEQFKTTNMITDCLDCNDIWKKIEEVKKTEFRNYISNNKSIIQSIDQYLESLKSIT